MARKFLYVVATLIVLVIAALFAMRIWQDDLTRIAFEPTTAFNAQPALAADAWDDRAMWVARPDIGAGNPALFRPDGAVMVTTPGPAAVFFIHPTSYLVKDSWNAAIADQSSRALAERLTRMLASPFAEAGDVWAPRYRQATFGTFLSDSPDVRRTLDLAYGDVRTAFDKFLAQVPAGRPIILVGHSQGALHLKRLIAERVAGTPLAPRVVAAYAIGWPVSLEHDLPAMGMPACAAPDQAGCVLSWLSYAEPADPDMTREAYERMSGLDGKPLKGSAFLCTNPLTGKVGGSAPASAGLGTLVPDAEGTRGKLQAGMVPARCGPDGFLYIGKGPELGPYVLPGNNYHVYDIPLFWANVRADAVRRTQAWLKTR